MSQKQEGSRSRADYFLHLALALLRWKLAGPVAFTSLVRCVGASSVAFWQSGRVSTCQPTERQAKPPFDSVGKEADEGGRGGGGRGGGEQEASAGAWTRNEAPSERLST